MDNYAERKIVLVITTLAAFLTTFMSSAVTVALPVMGRQFSMGAVALSWVAAIYILAAATFLLPFGRLADLYGRKHIFLYGVLLLAVSSLAAALAGSGGMIIGARAFQGIGASLLFATSVPLLISVYPPEQRGRVLGINVAATYLGLSFGPVFGGFLTYQFGWRSIFAVNTALSLSICLLVLWKVKGEWGQTVRERFDLPGALIYMAGFAVLMYGLSVLPSPRGITFAAAGAAAIVLFLFWEDHVEHPLLDVRLFLRNHVFAFSNLAALINYSATFAASFLMSLYLQYIKGFDTQSTGLLLAAQPVMQALFSPFAGRLSDRVEPRIVASIGMGLTVLGLALLAFLSATSSIAFIVATLLLLGFGFALFSSPNTNAIMGSVEKEFYGVASGTLGTMRLSGQMMSMALVMFIFSLNIGPGAIVPEKYPFFLHSFREIFAISAAFCVLGVLASLFRGNLSDKN